MKLLILGESGSMGIPLPDPSTAWGNRLPNLIEEGIQEPVETVHIRYYPWGHGYLDYLERTLQKGPFDVVVLSITKVGFSVYSVDNRLRKIFGDRVGDWVKKRVWEVDGKTFWHRNDDWLEHLNRRVHAVGSRIIGQAPMNSMQTVAEGYIATMSRLVRLEQTQVVILNSGVLSGTFAKRRPKLARQSEQYRVLIREAAKKRYIDIVERQDVLEGMGGDPEDQFIKDGLHRGDDAQPALAGAIADVIIARQGGARRPSAETATV